MKFRPCIDLHEGIVKQIVGGTLTDDNEGVTTNFTATQPPKYFAELYKKDSLTGGHVIMLGKNNTKAATEALEAYPNGLQVGGGINDTNAKEWLEKGASHVIITSYVFVGGAIEWSRLEKIKQLVGKDRIVLDLSCRRKPLDPRGPYFVVTDRWQKFTETPITPDMLVKLADYCAEFLVHGVDVEGKQSGILEDLVEFLGKYSPIPVTYAGGIRNLADVELVKKLGCGSVDITIGSALDIFGGSLSYDEVVDWHRNECQEM